MNWIITRTENDQTYGLYSSMIFASPIGHSKRMFRWTRLTASSIMFGEKDRAEAFVVKYGLENVRVIGTLSARVIP